MLFSLALMFFIVLTTSVIPSFWMYYAENVLGWGGPSDLEAFLSGTLIIFDPDLGFPHLSPDTLLQIRDIITMGLITGPDHHDPGGRRGAAELAEEAPGQRRRHPAHRRVPLMPFTKTEVDIHDDYVVEQVDPAWLAQGVKSPKHLMLDPDNCILCRACEDVCPWNCIWMMSPEIVEGTDEEAVGAEVSGSNAIFVVDDNACTRCSVCVDRCPTDTLYYARLPESAGGRRSMAEVPTSQADEA